MTQSGGRKLSGPEIVEEVEWLLSYGRSPFLIAQELHRSCDSIYKIGVRWGSEQIKSAFGATAHQAYRGRVTRRNHAA